VEQRVCWCRTLRQGGALSDKVNHPDHYTAGGIETIDFIEAKQLCYHRGNAIKYISRSHLKGNVVEDIQKAIWYLNRYLEVHNNNKEEL